MEYIMYVFALLGLVAFVRVERLERQLKAKGLIEKAER